MVIFKTVDPRTIKIARRFHERNSLEFPVQIDEIVKEFADLVIADFPSRADGLCVNLKIPGKRPTVLVKPNGSERRRRFTLAHELGHLLIPWHAGHIVDYVDPDGNVDLSYWYMEREANTFASEFLMPEDLVSDIIVSTSNVRDAIERIYIELHVSYLAALYRIVEILPRNNIICFSSSVGERKCLRSPGTRLMLPGKSDLFFATEDELPNGEKLTFSLGSYSVVHWYFPDSLPLPAVTDQREWREILEECITFLEFTNQTAYKLKQSLNGIISSINSTMRDSRDETEIYAQFVHRISVDERFSILLSQSSFHQFVVKRIKEFVSRRQ